MNVFGLQPSLTKLFLQENFPKLHTDSDTSRECLWNPVCFGVL